MSKASTLASEVIQKTVSGLWRLSGSARATPAVLSIDGSATTLVTGDGVAVSLPLSTLQISDRIGSIPRYITFPDQGVFETADNDGIDALMKPHVGRHAGLIHQLERFHPRLFVFVALAIAFCFALYRFAVPALVEVAVLVTPPVVPQLMSQSALVSLDKTVFSESGLAVERQKTLVEKFRQIAAFTPDRIKGDVRQPAPYTLNFRKGGIIGPNAFALPDGTVVLTDELVELAGQDDEIVLGVLAHEIGHVDHRHSLRQLYRAAGVATLIMFIGGDIGSGTEDVLVQGSAVLALSYSRSAEAEADRYSVELMHKAGHDPLAITRFFELLRTKLGESSDSGFLSTHPATPERIAETRRYAEEIAAGK
ncbi:MAG TPA: M48 family metallopeptidase [Mesorhizobium sp.]|jgi:Zn-dependent protease with chaperone function|uniref:M48 family metallopeptidase n=1 Tax=Mesorhizobium sp. TaxID=1871066 RepID=UPI002DDDB567|nr:M48 family metallopeptidase [Mesorhizobium sp.]HEV2503969.1 M48 family metallopeptidase [Mesorhizobium sp.]